MKTAMSCASIETYHQIGAITADLQLSILALFEPGIVMTRKEIAKRLELETSTVAGRCNELLHANRLIESGTKRCQISGRVVGALCLPLLT
jgi:hypothetical protein